MQEMDRSVSIEMPKYVSHKEVHALKIEAAYLNGHGSEGFATLVPENKEYAPIQVNSEYWNKHKPYGGGYYVVYPDGYKSFSPQGAFESGYTLID